MGIRELTPLLIFPPLSTRKGLIVVLVSFEQNVEFCNMSFLDAEAIFKNLSHNSLELKYLHPL